MKSHCQNCGSWWGCRTGEWVSEDWWTFGFSSGFDYVSRLSLHSHHCPTQRSALVGYLAPILLSEQFSGTTCPWKQAFPSKSFKSSHFYGASPMTTCSLGVHFWIMELELCVLLNNHNQSNIIHSTQSILWCDQSLLAQLRQLGLCSSHLHE